MKEVHLLLVLVVERGAPIVQIVNREYKLVFILFKMPYRKDNIGDTPYYVPAYETRFFRPVVCERIHKSLRGLGINVHKSKGQTACELTYLDSYSAYVDELSKPHTLFKTFTATFL